MADQPVTKEKLINADKDVQVIEDFIKKPKDETVTTRFGDEIMTLKGLEEEVKKSGGYFKRYTSLAAANADLANIPVDAVVKVTSATDGGDYEKAAAGATNLTRSPYDPVEQAKNYTNTYAFAAKSAISDSTLLLSYKNIGIYYGIANLTLSDRPEGSYQSRQFMLKNEPYTSNGRFVLQTYQEVQTELKNEWRRVIDTVNNTVLVDWVRFNEGVQSDSVTALMLKNSVVSRAKLTDSFLYSGVIANTDDMNAITKDGLHVVTSRPLNTPSGSATTALVQIENHNNFVRQTWQNLDDSQKVWRRVIRPNASTPTFEAWKDMNPSQVPSVIASPTQLGLIKVGANLSIDENGVLSASGGGSGGYFSGKKMVCFGDSVTEFGDYPERIKNRLDLASAVNVGFGGCRMAAHESVKYTEMSMFKLANTVATQDFTLLDMRAEQLAGEGDDNRPAVARLKAVNFTEVDYVTIFYGTNDWAGNVPIGENTDLTADGSTFKGSINYAVKRLLETYPHLKILFITPTWRARFVNGDGLESDTNPNSIGKYLIEYVDAIKEVAALNKIPTLDMYRESGINKYNSTLYFTDGLHPTDPVGFQHIANKISSSINASY